MREEDELRAALAPRPVSVPGPLDERLLAAARAADRRARRPWVLAGLGSAAAAAALALLLLRPAPLHDLNGDGRFDVLDAFRLARALDDGTAPPPGSDLNRDGRIDAADLDQAARELVQI